MIQVFKKAIFRHGYLAIVAAWLYTISFVITNYVSFSSSPASVKKNLETYIASREKDIDEIITDEAALTGILADGSNKYKTALTKKDYGLFTYVINDIGNPVQLYWNSNAMSVLAKDLKKPDGSYPVQYQNGLFELVKQTREYKGSTYIVAALIPLHWEYFVQNAYLQNSFAGYPSFERFYEIDPSETGMPVANSDNKVLYHFVQKKNVDIDRPDGWSIALRVFAIVLFFIFINAVSTDLAKERGFFWGFGFLFSGMIISRVLSYYSPFPFNFRSYGLFDPGVYATSDLHRSLGDLLINVVFFYWLVIFTKFNNLELWDKPYKEKKNWMHVLTMVCICAIPVVTFSYADIIKSLVVDSQISFDVTNIFSLTSYTLICFLLLCFMILSFYHLVTLLLLPAYKLSYSFFNRISLITASGLVFVTINPQGWPIDVRILILIWIMLFSLLCMLRRNDHTVAMIKSPFFLFWVIFFSAFITILVTGQYRDKEFLLRKNLAERLALKTDQLGENLMNFSTANLPAAFTKENFERLSSENFNRHFKDSLLKDNFSGYLNKYDTRIYTFNKNFAPLFNDDRESFYVLRSIVKNRGIPTGVDDLYYYESMRERFLYIYSRAVTDPAQDTLGYLFIVLKPKLYRSESLFPELFKQGNDFSTEGYSYALYSKQKLIANFNSYTFSDTLMSGQLPKFEFELRKFRDNDELWYNAGNAKTVVVIKKNNRFAESLTFFSYLFTTFILVVILFQVGIILFAAKFRWRNIKNVFNFNIRTQILAIIIFISLFSFLVIGATTISFFIKRYYNNNQEKLAKNIQVISSEVEARIKTQLTFDDQSEMTDLVSNGDLERKIVEISEEHNADVNIYDESGTLRESTQRLIYSKQILSTKMQPDAYYNLRYARKLQYLQNERVGNTTYLSAYTPIREENGDVIAYLNIPYLNAEKELNQEISNFLVTLIDLNALIFLLAGAIALLVTNRITSSFTLISNRMKEINLGKMNEEIEWKSTDEIGVLVKEYNKMVHKLEESAHALAQSEREDAWREMARQVAHEIKNPLTPMKLSIQYMQRAIDSNAPNVKELSSRVANTLIEQIEQLSKIAGDFSQFANIASNLHIERLNINDVLQSVITLYKTDSSISLLWDKQSEEYVVEADRVQLSRLFTNLIKNAIEASAGNNPIRILIGEYRKDNKVVIYVKDYGTGIQAHMQQKIFEPNFTTKSSGTGLGLAICKAIAETAKGQIWFETTENIGTTFFVALPLVNQSL